MTPLVSIQNPDPEKCQEVRERELASFSILKKNRDLDMGEKWCPRVLGLCFFLNISPPFLGLWFFFQNTEIGKFSLSLSLPDIFQDQGSGYSLRVSSGRLYSISPVTISCKCLGCSNLLVKFYTTLPYILPLVTWVLQSRLAFYCRVGLLLHKLKKEDNLTCASYLQHLLSQTQRS